jgi:hypothetical protein
MYKLTRTDAIIRLSDNTTIPADDRNNDYREYLAWVADGGIAEPYIGPEQNVTIDMVAAERKRRLALGFDYNFGDARGVHRIGTTEDDRKNWDEVNVVANAAINLGLGSTVTIGVLTDTGPATVTALEWQSVLLHAGEVRQPIFQASFDLQKMNPIPPDYTDDQYWP